MHSQTFKTSKKTNLIFSSYWDSNCFLQDKRIFTKIGDNILDLDLSNPNDIKYYSISISHPPLDKLKYIKDSKIKIGNLTCLNPHYSDLLEYKQNKDFISFSNKYIDKLMNNLGEFKAFLKGICHKNIILNCWESTGEKVYCHRRLVYNLLSKSDAILKHFNLVYRHGNLKEFPDTLIAAEKIEEYNLW